MKKSQKHLFNSYGKSQILAVHALLCFVAAALPVLNNTAEAAVATETVVHAFDGDGADPNGPLIQASDGNYYGTTYFGGTYGFGTVFKLTPSGTLTTLYSFGNAPGDGGGPEGGLTVGTDGDFYGATNGGGSYGYGTVFKITLSGTLTTLYSFSGVAGDGSAPAAPLALGSDGNFYGTTTMGGAFNNGTVFKASATGVVTILYSFGATAGDGINPSNAGIVMGKDGNFYGTTVFGGANDIGTVFKITPSGSLSTLHSFAVGGDDGAWPFGTMILAADGNFYGTTKYGGTYEEGTVFKLTPSGAISTLHSMQESAVSGSYPQSGLVQGRDGNFYGTTDDQGFFYNGYGTVFRITPTGELTTLYQFCGSGYPCSDGYYPTTRLIQGADGAIYGTTYFGGYGLGTIFKIQVANVVPVPPTNLTARPANGYVSLKWTGSPGASGYYVYEGTTSGGEAPIVASGVISTTSTTVGYLKNGLPYYFQVAAVGLNGTSAKSNEAVATPNDSPGPVTSLVAQAGKLQAQLRWTVSTGAMSYVVMRSTVPGAEIPIAEGITTTKYTAGGLDSGTTYYFEVVGKDTYGIGPVSPEVSVTPQ